MTIFFRVTYYRRGKYLPDLSLNTKDYHHHHTLWLWIKYETVTVLWIQHPPIPVLGDLSTLDTSQKQITIPLLVALTIAKKIILLKLENQKTTHHPTVVKPLTRTGNTATKHSLSKTKSVWTIQWKLYNTCQEVNTTTNTQNQSYASTLFLLLYKFFNLLIFLLTFLFISAATNIIIDSNTS